MNSPWLLRFAPRPAATLRLFCFSYAGGGAAIFRPWALAMPAHVEVAAVLLPGRESRLREKPLDSMAALLQALLPALMPELDRPFAFFGHSMGALLAFEVARALVQSGRPAPARLMASGRCAPHLADGDAALHALDDDAFVAAIDRRYGGIPAQILQDREVLEMLLPSLRADMAAIESYRHHGDAPLPCPIAAFGGSSDARTTLDKLQAWQLHSTEPVTARHFPGGHFYFNDAAVRGQLLAEVNRLLAPLHTAAALAPYGPTGSARPATEGAVLAR